jgi:hypothetical protein
MSVPQLQRLQSQILSLTTVNDQFRKDMQVIMDAMGENNDEITRLEIKKHRLMNRRDEE